MNLALSVVLKDESPTFDVDLDLGMCALAQTCLDPALPEVWGITLDADQLGQMVAKKVFPTCAMVGVG